MPHLQPAANLYIHNRIRWQMNGSIPPHLPQSIRQPKSGRMAGVQRCGRSPATVFPMIINQLEARCRSARSFSKYLKYRREKTEMSIIGYPSNSSRRFQNSSWQNKKTSREKLNSSWRFYAPCFIGMWDLLHRPTRLASLTYATSLVDAWDYKQWITNPSIITQAKSTHKSLEDDCRIKT